jgi:hypothetical protein
MPRSLPDPAWDHVNWPLHSSFHHSLPYWPWRPRQCWSNYNSRLLKFTKEPSASSGSYIYCIAQGQMPLCPRVVHPFIFQCTLSATAQQFPAIRRMFINTLPKPAGVGHQ